MADRGELPERQAVRRFAGGGAERQGRGGGVTEMAENLHWVALLEMEGRKKVVEVVG